MPKRNINLTPECLDQLVERRVASEHDGSACESARKALRFREEDEEMREAKLKALRQAAGQGFDELDQGRGIALKGKEAIGQMITQIEGEIRMKAAKNGN